MQSSYLWKRMRNSYGDNAWFKNTKNVFMNLRRFEEEFVETEFSTICEKKEETWILQHQNVRQVKRFIPLFIFSCFCPLEYVFTCTFV